MSDLIEQVDQLLDNYEMEFDGDDHLMLTKVMKELRRINELEASETEILNVFHIVKECHRYTWMFHGIRYKTLAECIKCKINPPEQSE